jgi:iron complex transport system permease protein
MSEIVKRVSLPTLGLCTIVAVASIVLAVCIGAVSVPASEVLQSIGWHLKLPYASHTAGTNDIIIWQLRLPRVILAFVVGSMLASAGATYQGTFRNPLADPYLLGVSAGAGLGATFAIVSDNGISHALIPAASFLGAMGAVALTYSLGRSGISGRMSASLVLAGVAVANLLTAIQTLVQQQHNDKIREVYSWVLGTLNTTGWNDVRMVAPYIAMSTFLLYRYRRVLDVFSVGDDEATTLGLPVERVRAIVIIAATLGTAAAVSVTGLIGFVGIIVPHTLRLLVGNSYRVLIPLSIFGGGIFLVCADLVARTALAPTEIPIGIVTALIGAPFFLYILGSSRTGARI